VFRLLKEQERLPDLWFRVNAESRYMKAVKAAADFVECDFEDIFLVDNATTGELCNILNGLCNFFFTSGLIVAPSLAYEGKTKMVSAMRRISLADGESVSRFFNQVALTPLDAHTVHLGARTTPSLQLKFFYEPKY